MKLLFVGDVMLGRLVNKALRSQPPEYPWGDTLPVFRQADLRICNLECAMSDRGRPWSNPRKLFHFRTDAKNVAVLEAAGIDAVSLANNHVLDYEDDALFDTLAILDSKGIAHSGAGDSLQQAREPGIVAGGLRPDGTIGPEGGFGLLAFTDNEPDWSAGGARPGTRYVPVDLEDDRAQALLGSVTLARRELGLVAVSAHWGPNWGYEPPAAHIPFAHALIDAGADIVFGHSGHVFRGVEFYRGRPIIYCAGDFIDDYAIDEIERNDESFIFVVELEDGEVRLMLHPTVVEGFRARLATGYHAEAIAGKMSQLCEDLGTRAQWLGREMVLELTP